MKFKTLIAFTLILICSFSIFANDFKSIVTIEKEKIELKKVIADQSEKSKTFPVEIETAFCPFQERGSWNSKDSFDAANFNFRAEFLRENLKAISQRKKIYISDFG